MSALRMLEAEREIPMDRLIPTIEQALVLAYQRSPGAIKDARAELDTKTGRVTIWAAEVDEDGNRTAGITLFRLPIPSPYLLDSVVHAARVEVDGADLVTAAVSSSGSRCRSRSVPCSTPDRRRPHDRCRPCPPCW